MDFISKAVFAPSHWNVINKYYWPSFLFFYSASIDCPGHHSLFHFLLNWLYIPTSEQMGMTLFFRSPLESVIGFLFRAIAIKGFITFGNYYFPLVAVRWMQIALSHVPCIVSLRETTVVYIPVSFLRHVNADNDARPIRNYSDKRNSVQWIKSTIATVSPSLPLPPFLFAIRARSPKFYVFCRPLPIIDLSIYPLLCHPPAANIPREILNSACSDERMGEIVSQERRIRHGQNGEASSVSLPAYW